MIFTCCLCVHLSVPYGFVAQHGKVIRGLQLVEIFVIMACNWYSYFKINRSSGELISSHNADVNGWSSC